MKFVEIGSKAVRYIGIFIRKFDLFSQKIMLTYKGESSFSTVMGGLVSLAILTVVGIYTGFLMQTMVNREKSNNSLSTEVVDLITNDENYYPVVLI